jgi:hypothetical protein
MFIRLRIDRNDFCGNKSNLATLSVGEFPDRLKRPWQTLLSHCLVSFSHTFLLWLPLA